MCTPKSAKFPEQLECIPQNRLTSNTWDKSPTDTPTQTLPYPPQTIHLMVTKKRDSAPTHQSTNYQLINHWQLMTRIWYFWRYESSIANSQSPRFARVLVLNSTSRCLNTQGHPTIQPQTHIRLPTNPPKTLLTHRTYTKHLTYSAQGKIFLQIWFFCSNL